MLFVCNHSAWLISWHDILLVPVQINYNNSSHYFAVCLCYLPKMLQSQWDRSGIFVETAMDAGIMAQRPQQPSRPDSEEVIKYMKVQGLEGATSVQLDTTNPSGISEQSTQTSSDLLSTDKMLVVRPQQPQCHLQ